MHLGSDTGLRNLAALAIATLMLAGGVARAADSANPQTTDVQTAPSSSTSGSGDDKMRSFYDVLDDVLGDFEYDLKNGGVQGLKDLAIRNVAMSENVPPSFRSHLELLITERILRTTKARMIQCVACRARKTTLNGDQVMVTSPENDPAEIARIAKLAGIANFMDVAFSYQPSGIVLSMFIADPETGSIIWSRSYNSETSRAAAYRRGVDFSQVDDARKQTEYQPTIQYRAMVYYLFEPNVSGTSGTLGLGYRMMERYDNRKKEVGFELDYLVQSSTLVGGNTNGSQANIYGGFNLTLLFMHAWNLIGNEENYNKVRGSIFAGVGGTYASGYLGGLFRGGYEWRLGKHYAITPTVGYRPTSTVFVSGTSGGQVSGVEFGAAISMLF